MPDCCAAAECKQSPSPTDVAFFRFPLDPERCKQWVGNCGRPDLQLKTPEHLHRHFKLCSKHFEPSFLHKENQLKCVLKDDAVPTIFHSKTNKDKTQTIGRKRTRQSAAEGPVKAKKTKDDLQAADPQPSVKEESGEYSVAPNPVPVEPQEEDPATSKAKDTLKVYFKETLALTGFSIGNNATLSATTSMGSGPVGQLNPICLEKIESKEVLKLGEDVMREEIRNTLRSARFFSILLQDKTNIEGKDQIPVFIRTVTADGFPQKHLMGFLPCELDSDSLFLTLVSEIRSKWGLRMEHCRGFTYLTTGDLCQKLKELSCRMLRDFPQVVLAPSDPYAFNMWLIRSMPVLPIQDVVETVEEVASVLRRSPTLMKKLCFKITAAYGHIKGEVDRVKESCQNNWEYGTDAFQTMLDILEPLLNSIGEMCTSALSDLDAAIVEQLLKLKEKLKNFNFIISLVVLKNTLCCVSILNPSLRGIISISSTLQYTISNALKLLNKHLQEIPIFHRKWFSDAVGRAKKLGVIVPLPVDIATNGDAEAKPHPTPEDYYRETLSKKILQYLIDEVKRVLGIEMVRILRWLSLVPSYMADHNFSIRKDKVADANLNNLARPDSFYDELGCWEVKWRHASKRRILPTSVFATLKIPDIGFYPNVQSLLRVLGSIPCINADADVYGQYDMVLDRYHSYMKEVPAEQRLCNMAFVYINQDVHVSIEDMVQSYVEHHSDTLQLLCKDEMMEVQLSVPENNANDASKEDPEEPREMTLNMEMERQKPADCTGTDKEALKSALQAAITAACNSQSRQPQAGLEGEVEYVTKSEMNEVLKVCEDVVRERILSEVGNSFYSLFIDRAVRFGDAELLPLFLRFVDSFDVMRLELMGFVDVNLDTQTMCERLFDIVSKEWCLNLKNCRGQAYLGSGEVAYKLKAFACKVQEEHPLAICTHCSCYSFNTWWSRSVPVAAVSRAIDTLEKVVVFFSSIPDLERELDQVLAVGLRESYEKVNELQGTFCASWMEKHDSYDVFAQILEPLVQCLESLQSSSPQIWSLSVINQAKKLLHLIRDFDFIVAVVALKNVSSFTRELSVALQKDHFSAASQLCQIGGIVATLNRVKTNIKVFHQNWFDEACTFAQSLGVQVKVPDTLTVSRDGLLKPGGFYKDAVSLPLVDHLINSVKDHFSDDHKEALNFLSLVPCSVTMSYTFESLKSKPPLYVGDLPDPTNFFTELSCWKVKWKTKVVSPTVPDSIFQTLRLPLMQYFGNINTLLKIMCVLPSTALEYCGEVNRHKLFQDYLKNTYAKDRSPCLAMLQLGANFTRDLEKMVAQCLKVTPKTLEGICLDKEAKTLLRNSDTNDEVENHKNDVEGMEIVEVLHQNKALELFSQAIAVCAEVNNHKDAEAMDMQQQQPLSEAAVEDQQTKPLDENGHSADNLQSSERVFRVAAKMARKNCLISNLPKEEQDCIIQELGTCHWDQGNIKFLSDEEILQYIVKSIRGTILAEIQESPFFSIITDKLVSVDDQKYIPVFVRYVDDCTPKVELLGFLPFESSDAEVQAKTLSDVLTDEWGLQMAYCRGQSFMCMGATCQSLRKMSVDFLANYPLAVNTPSESCGLAYWLAVSLPNDPITKVLGVVEDLLLFFDQSPRLHIELSQTMEGLLNTPREALAEVPETCLSRWKKMEDFFDILVDMLEGVLSCLDSVSNNANGTWSNSMSIHALILSTAIRESDFVIPLVILKNICAPLRNCSTVFRCGNPADIICELEKIPQIVETLSKMLENISVVHTTWFEEAAQLAAKVSGGLSYPETVVGYESPELGYREMVSRPVLSGLIEEMKFNFDECHLKALKVLSLLPTCNPLPILPEAPDKLYTIYHSDLPEPDTVEEDINTWATAWREKYQETSPPASISETLHHPEAKSHPNVTALLKLVAVLPSISMEFDLMKTTLNSMRTFLRNDIICRGSKTNTVMLLMHRQILQTLEEVIDMCMANDPESHGFLAQMKQNVSNMRIDGEIVGVYPEVMAYVTNGSGEGAALTTEEDQPENVQCEIRELSAPAPNDTTEVPVGLSITAGTAAVENVITLDLAPVPEVTSVALTEEVAQSVTTETLTVVIAQSDTTEVPTVVAAQDITTQSLELISEAVHNVTTEPATNLAAEVLTLELVEEPQINTTESLTEVSTDSTTTIDSVTQAKIATSESVAAAAVVMLELSASQGITTEPEMEAAVQGVPIDPAPIAEDSTMELTEAGYCTAIGHAVETLADAAELATHVVTTDHDTVAEDASLNTEAVESISPDAVPVTETVAGEDVAIDSVQTTETITATQDVTLSLQVPAAQYIISEPVMEAAVQDVPIDPDAAAEDGTMEIETAYCTGIEHAVETPSVAAELAARVVSTDHDIQVEDTSLNPGAVQSLSPDAVPVTETVAVEGVAIDSVQTTETVTATEGVTLSLQVPAAQYIISEPVMEAAVQDVPIDADAAAEDSTMKLTDATYCTAIGHAVETHSVAAELTAHAVTIDHDTAAENASLNTEAVESLSPDAVHMTETVAVEGVAIDSVQTTETVTATHGVTLSQQVPAAQYIISDPVVEAGVQHVSTEPDLAVQKIIPQSVMEAAFEDVSMELPDVEEGAVPETELPAQGLATVSDKYEDDVPMDFAVEAEAASTEHATELVPQHVPTDPVETAQDVLVALSAAAQVTATELVTVPVTSNSEVGSTEDTVLYLSESTYVNTEAPTLASNCTNELITTVTKPGPTATEDDHMKLPEAEECTASVPSTEPPVQDVTDEDVPIKLLDEEKGASPVPVTTSQDVPVELPVEMQVTATELVTEPSTQNVTSESSASAEDVLNLSESTPVHTEAFTSASNISELVKTQQGNVTELGPAQRFDTESVMEEAVTHVTPELNTSARDDSMEPTEVDQCTVAVPVTEMEALEKAAEDVPMNLPDERNDASPEPPVQRVTMALKKAAEDVPLEIPDKEKCTSPVLVTIAQDVPMEFIQVEQCAAAMPVTEPSAQNTTLKPVASAEDVVLGLSETTHVSTVATTLHAASNVIEEPLKTEQDGVPEHATKAQQITLEPSQGVDPKSAAQANIQDQVYLQDIAMEPEEAQSATLECVSPAPDDDAMELAGTEGVAVEPIPLPQVSCTMNTAVGQEVVSDVASAPTKNASETQSISTEPQINVQSLSIEPIVAVPDVSTKPLQVSSGEVQNVTTEPLVAAVASPSEPAVATCKVEELRAAVPNISKEPVEEPRTNVKYVTTKPIVPAVGCLTEPAVAACLVTELTAVPDMPKEPRKDGQTPSVPIGVPVTAVHGATLESTAAQQHMITESTVPAQCVTVKPVSEDQGLSPKPVTPAPDISTEPATTVWSVTIEPTEAVQEINMESVPSEYPNNVESVSDVATEDVIPADGVAVNTAKAQNVSTPPMSTKPILEALDASMDPTAMSKDVTVEDVVMESVQETQVSEEPKEVVKGVVTEPDTDINMEAVPEEQDVFMEVDQGASVEHLVETEDTKLKNESQDISSQVISPTDSASPAHQDDQQIQPIVVTQADTIQATASDQPAISPVSSVSQSSLDGSKTVTVEEVADQARSAVQDSIYQSQAVSYDTGHPIGVTQEAGQDESQQPMEVAQDETVPHRVLFFYDDTDQQALVKEYATSKFFSFTFEEQVEIEGHPYIPVGISYMDQETLCEDVLAFILLDKDINAFVDSMTAALTDKFGLNFAFCRGQSILTVGVAGKQMRAVAALFSQRYPQAVRTLNSSVSLNVWLARSSPVTEIADCSMWVEKLLHWLTEDAEKQAKLQSIVRSLFKQDESRYGELSDKLNEIQWERRHDVFELTVEILEAILLCLNDIKDNGSNQAERAQAVHFLSILRNVEFILTVVILKNILSLTKNMSQSLQGGSLDLCQAVNSLPDLLSTLNDMTLNIDSRLQTWLQEALVLASKLKISVHHSIQPVIVHYRDVVSKGAVTYSVNEITALFSSSVLSAVHCMQVVPYVISKMEGGCMDVEPFKVYREDLPEWGALQVELRKWREKWLTSLAAQHPLPTCVLDTLKATDASSFTNIEMILRVLVVLPCCRGEGTVRQGKKSLTDFIQQRQTTLRVLYPS